MFSTFSSETCLANIVFSDSDKVTCLENGMYLFLTCWSCFIQMPRWLWINSAQSPKPRGVLIFLFFWKSWCLVRHKHPRGGSQIKFLGCLTTNAKEKIIHCSVNGYWCLLCASHWNVYSLTVDYPGRTSIDIISFLVQHSSILSIDSKSDLHSCPVCCCFPRTLGL